jgi:DNA-directed RNA polymerase specialized sigma subunit
VHLDPNILVKEYEALVKSLAQKFKRTNLDFDDLYQEGMLGLLEANRRYDPTKGAVFATYAHYWISKHMHAAQRSCSGEFQTDPDMDIADCPAPEPPPETGSAPLRLPKEMPVNEARVIRLSYGECLSIRQISKQMGISVEQVKQLRGKALRRLRSLASTL